MIHNIMYVKHLVWERDSFICQYCGLDMEELYKQWMRLKIKRKAAMLTVDHVIPKSKGGTWEITNLLTCCFKCNQKKANNEIKIPIPTRRQKIVYRLLDMLVMWGEWAKKRRARNPSHSWSHIR